MNTISNSRRGFTLIELLVVLTIIGLLTAILLPVFASAREKARQSVCESNLHQIDLGIQMYQADNNGILPDRFFDVRNVPANEQTAGYAYDLLAPYEHDPNIYHCSDSPDPGKPGNLILDYNYRVYDMWSLEDTQNLPEAMMKPSPASVLVYDENHQRGDNPIYIVLRTAGSVSRIESSRVVTWVFLNGKWLHFSAVPPGTVIQGNQIFPVFSDEPWPPQFQSEKMP